MQRIKVLKNNRIKVFNKRQRCDNYKNNAGSSGAWRCWQGRSWLWVCSWMVRKQNREGEPAPDTLYLYYLVYVVYLISMSISISTSISISVSISLSISISISIFTSISRSIHGYIHTYTPFWLIQVLMVADPPSSVTGAASPLWHLPAIVRHFRRALRVATVLFEHPGWKFGYLGVHQL